MTRISFYLLRFIAAKKSLLLTRNDDPYRVAVKERAVAAHGGPMNDSVILPAPQPCRAHSF